MTQIRSQYIWTGLILLASLLVVLLVTSFTPSLSAASTNILFRLRGVLEVPDDVLIVSIDDRSLQSLGRWPWPRSVMADALEKIAAARPRVVGLDVVYAEPSVEKDDRRLAEAVRNNGRVVLPAQLLEAADEKFDRSGAIVWMRPVIDGAAAVGHVHVSPDVDGILRAVQLSKTDDAGVRIWAFGLEVVRVAERIPMEDFQEEAGVLRFGPYEIPLRDVEPGSETAGVQVVRPNEMLINYAGPASFRRYSLVDVLGDRVPTEALKDKIVLVGSVSPSMGDARISPFIAYSANEGMAGQEMPGVEVHANIINTIRQRLGLRLVPERYGLLITVGIVLLTTLVVNRLDGWQQIGGLGVMLSSILIGGYFAFTYFLVILPLPGMLAGFAVAIPLLLNQTLSTSRRLDLKLAALARTQKGFLLDEGDDSATNNRTVWLDLPRDLKWKLRAVDDITTRLLARMNFMDRVLSGMCEGVLVTDPSGRVVFANLEAMKVFDIAADKLPSVSFADYFTAHGVLDPAELSEALRETSAGRVFEKEFVIQDESKTPRHYVLHFSAIFSSETPDNAAHHQAGDLGLISRDTQRVIGRIALLTDTTRRVELDRIRMETLQLVSHELRTPLTSIQGLSDVLLKFSVETIEARDMVAQIHAEAERLGETINRYLGVARLESGAQELRLTTCDVEELIAGCVRTLAQLAAERGIKIIPTLSHSLPALEADAQLLAQAISNLLSNAIKYSPADSEVSIEVESDAVYIRISVQDHGAGIPVEERELIFKKFYRLQRDAASGIIGTGLGLSLVKEIIEKHHGRVQLVSAPGSGSTFTIQLPIRADQKHGDPD